MAETALSSKSARFVLSVSATQTWENILQAVRAYLQISLLELILNLEHKKAKKKKKAQEAFREGGWEKQTKYYLSSLTRGDF